MMTSSNGTSFRVTGHLWGESTGHRWDSPHKDQWHGDLMFSLICASTNGWANNGHAGALRRHRAHYDVTVFRQSDNPCTFSLKLHWNWCQNYSRSGAGLMPSDSKPLAEPVCLSYGATRPQWVNDLSHVLVSNVMCVLWTGNAFTSPWRGRASTFPLQGDTPHKGPVIRDLLITRVMPL